MTMIERVARAIAKANGDDGIYKAFLPHARAAIEAMRQPTAKQLIDAREKWLADPARRSSTIYTAMIDAALATPAQGQGGEGE